MNLNEDTYRDWLKMRVYSDENRMEVIEKLFVAIDDIRGIILDDYPLRLDGFLFYLCLKGHCTLLIDLNSYEISPGSLVVTIPNHVIQLSNQSPDFTGKVLFVSRQFTEDMINRLQDVTSLFFYAKKHPCHKMNEKEVSAFVEYHSFLMKRIEGTSIFKRQICEGILSSLFYSACEAFGRDILSSDKAGQTRKHILFDRFIALLMDNYKTERLIMFYADKMCITPKYLSSLVKEVSGMYAGQWIDQAVILEAKVQLRNTDKTIQQISDELHFANQSFFGKYFRHHTGFSPSAYRHS